MTNQKLPLLGYPGEKLFPGGGYYYIPDDRDSPYHSKFAIMTYGGTIQFCVRNEAVVGRVPQYVYITCDSLLQAVCLLHHHYAEWVTTKGNT